MQVDLDVEELEILLLTMKQYERPKADAGQPATDTDDLIARLEQYQRDQRRAGPPPA